MIVIAAQRFFAPLSMEKNAIRPLLIQSALLAKPGRSMSQLRLRKGYWQAKLAGWISRTM
ncbi:hypothetical protein PV773_10980 [Mesorhizobium sp. CC13]|uniref:hypothetical protein n=1 Tax=Mesorhizobium sp. CC13 TaxID=3029194 RepID=UPI003262CFAB